MKESLETAEQFLIEVILERRRGIRASLLRFLLGGLSKIYLALVKLRLSFYRNRVLRQRSLGCTVISIGNLTVGGTGKTPVVELFARELQKGGRRVAILSRGYKSEKPEPGSPEAQASPRSEVEGPRGGSIRELGDPPRVVSNGEDLLLNSRFAGDEPYMLAKNLPGVPVLVDKDRIKSGIYAIREFGTDTLLLDDGLQYMRLQHRLDIVLVDRNSPFGNEKMLPRGTLREPPKNLRRASYIFITKCDGSSNAELIDRIRLYNRTAEIIECRHKPCYLIDLVTGKREELDFLDGKYIGTISGIAVPESFENGLKKLGATIELTRRYTDHHRYGNREVHDFLTRSLGRDVAMVVTTEKDSVRFPPLVDPDVPVYYLRMEIEILTGQDVWERCVAQICEEGTVPAKPGGFY